MEQRNYLDEFRAKDPTWYQAAKIASLQLKASSSVWRLIRNGWNGLFDPTEFVRALAMCHINPAPLLNAANIDSKGRAQLSDAEKAVQFLGVRYSSVVIGINYTCLCILRSKPPPVWRPIFEEMMTRVEIGYKLGSRAHELGFEGGALIAFAKTAGLGVLLSNAPKLFREWHSMNQGASGKKLQLEKFGCEAFQVSAFILQQLGFGPEISLGSAIATGGLDPKHISIDREILRWKAAFLWIEALRTGRNYPKEVEMRNFFPEIQPPTQPQEKKVALEVLYTEVARVKRDGSKWTWHLPKNSYEETLEALK
jgi:hypothetical protein